MKISTSICTLLLVLAFSSGASAELYDLSALTAEADKAVPDGMLLTAGAGDRGAFVVMGAAGLVYQFFLSEQPEQLAGCSRPVVCNGRKVSFFTPDTPGSGGLKIVLSGSRTLTIVVAAGLESDRKAPVTKAELCDVVGRINPDAL